MRLFRCATSTACLEPKVKLKNFNTTGRARTPHAQRIFLSKESCKNILQSFPKNPDFSSFVNSTSSSSAASPSSGSSPGVTQVLLTASKRRLWTFFGRKYEDIYTENSMKNNKTPIHVLTFVSLMVPALIWFFRIVGFLNTTKRPTSIFKSFNPTRLPTQRISTTKASL